MVDGKKGGVIYFAVLSVNSFGSSSKEGLRAFALYPLKNSLPYAA